MTDDHVYVNAIRVQASNLHILNNPCYGSDFSDTCILNFIDIRDVPFTWLSCKDGRCCIPFAMYISVTGILLQAHVCPSALP